MRAANPYLVMAHSDGIVSRFDDISVVLSTGRTDAARSLGNPFRFEPAIRGTVAWSDDGTRADFRPESPLSPGVTYRVVFDFAALGEPSNGWFSFKVRAAQPGLSVTPGELYAAFDGSLSLDGVVRTDDVPSTAEVERVLSARLGGASLPVSWSHETDGQRRVAEHRFTVKRIPRGSSSASLDLSWNGKPVGSDVHGSQRIRIPAESSFELLSVRGPEPGEPSCLTASFSAPVDKNQDFRGLIRANGGGDLRYEADGGLVRVYSAYRWPDVVDVTIEKGLKSQDFGSIAIPVSTTVRFDWQIPEVRFQEGGVIVPTSQGTRVVLETKNLAKVVVEALRVYGDNMPQFMQVNDLDGTKELKRVGDVVWREEVDLGWTDDKKNQWVPYALDLSPLLAKHPDGLFQLRVAFGHEHIRYASPTDHTNLGKWTFPPVQIRDSGGDSSYWDYYEEWFDWDEYYRYRDDPAHPAFYVQRYGRDRTARRNVLVSDVGIAAKLDIDGAWHVVSTDLKSARPLAGADVIVYSYAQRELARSRTDAAGMAVIRPATNGSVAGEDATKPFFIQVSAAGAKTGRDRGYLKLSPAQALAVSHFDIAGQKADTGIKGFIYGERGVWRPGDDIHLTFILYDRLKALPPDHPVRFELENPLGQIVRQATYTTSVGGFYYVKTGTDQSSPTGTWTARVNVGGSTFTKSVKIESVMPNRLKLTLDYGAVPYIGADLAEMGLKAVWLHGAPAPGLKADVMMMLSASGKNPGDFPGFSFQDPLRTAPAQKSLLFNGNLDQAGMARFPVNLSLESEAPGPLTATFMSRAFERSGLFSTEAFSLDFHPYARYVGLKLPAGDASRGMLMTDKDHPVELLLVDRDGKPAGNATVEIALYKMEWRWWWEKGQESLAEQASDIYSHLVQKDSVPIKNGRGSWKLRINYPEWGRYMIRVTDTAGGHAAGTVFYMDWPGWAGRGKGEGGGSAVMLSLSADKDSYAVGEPVRVSFPSNKEGRAFVTLERAGRVIDEGWVDAAAGTTVYQFKATADMAPNVYVHVSFIQPHLQTLNDLPIRLYGVIPVMVEDPATRLMPVIGAPATLEPLKKAVVTISERSGRPMTYTLAVVDEGLLGITRYGTPNPWNEMYKKEASLLSSFDLYKDVAGAFSGKLQTLISIGGSEFGDAGGTRKVSRFPPVVKFLGPYTLAKGAVARHDIELGPYVGAVRFMVVAGTQDGAYGTAELQTPVRSDLMAYITAPRMLRPGERLAIPVTVFGFMGKGSAATLRLKVEGDASIVGDSIRTVTFTEEGEQSASFELALGSSVGTVRLTAEASGPGGRTATHSVDIPVRSASVPVTTVTAATIAGKGSGSIDAALPGIDGSNDVWLELSLAPPIDLSGRLAYLLGYPHGCGEQTTSTAFPQLFLDDAMALTPEQQAVVQTNVSAAITKLAGFQTTSGGFVFWPGSYQESTWLSVYITHFLTMARRKGFTVQDSMMDASLGYLKSKAASWSSQEDYAKSEQAYRLYVLALAGAPDVASMNRFMEYGPYPTPAAYQMAAAYALAGMRDRAMDILLDAPTTVQKYNGIERVYGSVLRDRAMVLDAFNTLGDSSRSLPIFRQIAADLSSGSSYSTQDLGFALMASLPYLHQLGSGSAAVTYDYGGGSGSVSLSRAIARVPLSSGAGTMSVRLGNGSAVPLYARVVATGTPAPGEEWYRSEGLSLAAKYLDTAEISVDPDRMALGSDMIVEMSVRNVSGDALSDLALTFRTPSGWELANMRVGRSDEAAAQTPASFDYQDIRDDRVMTYFGLQRGETRRFRFYVNKAYDGAFFLPAATVEAMYRPDVFAVLPGRALSRSPVMAPVNPNGRGLRP
jgi:uncharacterized protein YfaS (alpha-2-macroglobulin family)